MTTNSKPGFTSIAIAVIALIAILAIGALVASAIEQGGWVLLVLLLGIVLVCGVVAWLISFGVRQYVQCVEARAKSRQSDNEFILGMAKAGFLPPGSKFQPVKQIDAPAPAAPRAEPVTDPRHRLLVDLCLLTIRADGYGPTSHRLMTADDAQAKGGQFAYRKNWDLASKYGQENGLIFEQRGGRLEQGMMVDVKRVGGDTVADLISALMKYNPVLDSAVNALPGVDR